MKKILLFIILLLCNISTVYAIAWVQVDNNNNYIDKDSIKIYVNDYSTYDYDKRIFWTKHVGNEFYQEIEKIIKKKIAFTLSQYIIDYKKQAIAVKTVVAYDINGQVISSCTYKDFQLDWNAIIPNSTAELWANLVKKPRILKKMYKIQQYSANNSK